MKTLKVFAPKADHAAIAALGRVVETYEAFVVVAVDDAAARKLLRRYPCEDMSAQYQLRIGGIDIDPLSDAARGRAAPPPVDDAPHHYLVQFVGPVKPAWLTALRKAGGTPRSPAGGFAYIVRADGAAFARIRALPWVRWAGHLRHEDRIATVLKGDEPPAATRGRGRAMAQVVTLEVFDAADLDSVAAEAARHGFEVLSRNKRARRLDLKVPDEGAMKLLVARLAEVHGVARIAPRSLPRTCNNVASRIVGRRFAAAVPPGLGLTGEGEVVAVCDTGLDTGRLDSLHPDFAGRVQAIKSYPIAAGYARFVRNPGANDGADDVDAGHGTHVAGSILGNGRASARAAVRIEGMAPRARLVFQAVEQKVDWKRGFEDEPFQLAGLPDDLASLFDFAYRQGARIHNNSWSGGTPGVYDASCRQIDRFVWDHRDFAIFVAAGNDGSDTGGQGKPADGRINPKSVTPPGTAKNCITVGASESLRPAFAEDTYGARWEDDYPVAPFRDDPLADDPDTLAPFSARGPTNDGRFKPDLVAPGTLILSTRSSRADDEDALDPHYAADPERYTFMTGTSMATPIAAGCATLLREALRKRHGIAAPSAALVKALLIAGCRRLPAGRGALVDHEQGFGRIDLQRSLQRVLLLHQAAGLHTGAVASLTIPVPTGRRTLRIAMAYTDFPGFRLVNNLNLFASGPGHARFVGNVAGRVHGGLLLDGSNNVEVIEAASAAPGDWIVQVVASNVPRGPQDFALVAVLV